MKPYSVAACLTALVLLHTGCGNNSGNPSASQNITATDSIIRSDSLPASGGTAAGVTTTRAETGVIINGTMLDEQQVTALKKLYGVEPKAGNYWYDSKSGLYGVVGYGAYGFMRAGHQFGAMKRNASAGNTSVLVNGRELPEPEWLVWSQLLGAVIAPGAYWLDENGNAGNEGNPVPTVNLYAAAQANGSSGGGGDNFWTSRFSAGNYNADNSQGYVSVPGYGPVGYGF